MPGLAVGEGDYLVAMVAMDGVELRPLTNPYGLLEGTAGRTIKVTVSSSPSMDGTRDIVVEPIAYEFSLCTQPCVGIDAPDMIKGPVPNDLRRALRSLGRRRTFAVTVVLTLVLAFSISTVVLSTVDRHFWRPLHLAESDRLFTLQLQVDDGRFSPLSHPEYVQFA